MTVGTKAPFSREASGRSGCRIGEETGGLIGDRHLFLALEARLEKIRPKRNELKRRR